MVEFVMPTCEKLVEQLHARRREMVEHFDKEGWSPGARNLLVKLDRMIAKYED